MSDLLSSGHRFTVGVLAICCVLGLLNVAYGLTSGKQGGFILAGAQAIFALSTGAAAWNVYYWRPAGRMLAIFVLLQWFSVLMNFRGSVPLFTVVMTVPIVLMYLWLRRPEVKAKFGAEKSYI
jgi:hypothetical protein